MFPLLKNLEQYLKVKSELFWALLLRLLPGYDQSESLAEPHLRCLFLRLRIWRPTIYHYLGKMSFKIDFTFISRSFKTFIPQGLLVVYTFIPEFLGRLYRLGPLELTFVCGTLCTLPRLSHWYFIWVSWHIFSIDKKYCLHLAHRKMDSDRLFAELDK